MGERLLHFNKQATRWLGVWLDAEAGTSQHPHEEGQSRPIQATKTLRTGWPVTGNCRRIQAVCVQADDLFGAELWWKGEGETGTLHPETD